MAEYTEKEVGTPYKEISLAGFGALTEDCAASIVDGDGNLIAEVLQPADRETDDWNQEDDFTEAVDEILEDVKKENSDAEVEWASDD